MNRRNLFKGMFAVAAAAIGGILPKFEPPKEKIPISLTFSRDAFDFAGVDFTSKDLALSIDDFSERFIQPAIKRAVDEGELHSFLVYHGDSRWDA